MNVSITYLDKKVLEKFLILSLILAHSLSNLSPSIFSKLFDILIYFLHLLDPDLILLLGLVDLQFNLLVVELGLEVLSNSLLLLIDVVVLFDSEFVTHAFFDAVYFLPAVLFNELDHVLKDLFCLQVAASHSVRYSI